MGFREICACAGLCFFVSLAASLIRCLCIFWHDGEATPDNPLFGPVSGILYGILFFLSFPVSVPRYFVLNYATKFSIDQALQEQRKKDNQFCKSMEEASYKDGHHKGFLEGKEDGYNLGYKDGYKDGRFSGYGDGYRDRHRGDDYGTSLNTLEHIDFEYPAPPRLQQRKGESDELQKV